MNPESRNLQSRNPESRSPESRNPESRNPESRNPESRNPESRNPAPDDYQIAWNIKEQEKQQNFLENQFKCSICLELYVKATAAVANEEKNNIARRCGHTFCEDCIKNWLNTSLKCPLCLSKIILTIPIPALESHINQFVEKYFSDEAKTARANLLKEREEAKRKKAIAEAANSVPARGAESIYPGPNIQYR